MADFPVLLKIDGVTGKNLKTPPNTVSK